MRGITAFGGLLRKLSSAGKISRSALSKKLPSQSFSLVVILLTLAFAVCKGTASAQTQPAKKNCAECHAAQAEEIKTAASKHRAVPCGGCHLSHPPAAKELQKCNRCHLKTRKAHFELEGCMNCHKRPHTPLTISFTDIKSICVSCHPSQTEDLRKNKSKHSAVECAACHNVHRKFPQCTQCHKPHSAEMAVSDCRKCHNAHKPKLVMYAADTPSVNCSSCHKHAADLLNSSRTKHASIACASCHQGKHKMVPKCQDCHGTPHPGGLMARFPKCGDCHMIAHDLNNWPPIAQKETPKEEQQRSKTHPN
jgi:hypothetical protein